MRYAFIALSVALSASSSSAQDCSQFHRTSDHGAFVAPLFGSAVAVDGDLALVGASEDDQGAAGAGAVYAYRFDGSDWVEIQKILEPTPRSGGNFGWSVDLSGEQAVIGAPGGGGTCHAFGYDRATDSWSFVQELLRADGGFQRVFGASVTIANGVALVGHEGDDDMGVDAGSAYVFRWESGPGAWIQETELHGPDVPPWAGPGAGASPGDSFGNCVDFDGLRAVVSAPFDAGMWEAAGSQNRGSVEVFLRDSASGTWTYDEHIRPCDLDDGQALGHSTYRGVSTISIDGDRAAVATTIGEMVFIFERDPVMDTWRKVQVMYPPIPGTGGYPVFLGFGTSVALRGDDLWVGCPSDYTPGMALVYRDSPVTGDFERTAILVEEGGQVADYFGAAIALTPRHAFVGSPHRYGSSGTQLQGALTTFDARCHRELGSPSCEVATNNSTGSPGVLRAFGSDDPAEGFVLLRAEQLPPGQFGYFLASPNAAQVFFPGGSDGVLCLGLPAGRYLAQVASSGPTGTLELQIDPGQMPPPLSAVQSGDVQYFQAWHRDMNPALTSNFTTSVGVLFQ